MKAPTLLLPVFLFSFHIYAQQLITLQHNNLATFHTSLSSAYTNSLPGDTLYLPGGIFAVDLTVEHEIHIVGVGHDPDFTSATGITTLPGGTIFFEEGSSNSSVTGLTIDGIYLHYYTYNDPISSIEISRCNISYVGFYSPSSYNTIKQSVIGTVVMENESNALYNNIITESVTLYKGVAKNNIFLNSDWYNVSNGNQSTIENNFFCSTCCPTATVNQCTFKNNIFIGNFTCGVTNLCSNNLTNISLSSIFMNYSGSGNFSYSDDFHLQATSPGKNAGTDGTDTGIYGGDFAWKEGSIPFNPHIVSKTISTKTNSSGNINVNVTVQAQEE